MEKMKLEVKKRTSYEGRRWNPGDIMEVSVDETEEYPLKGMVNTGIVERIERENPQDATDEGNPPLDVNELEDIEGIGPSYAEKIVEEYGTEEEILEVEPEDIADSLHGITPELAERVKEEIR